MQRFHIKPLEVFDRSLKLPFARELRSDSMHLRDGDLQGLIRQSLVALKRLHREV